MLGGTRDLLKAKDFAARVQQIVTKGVKLQLERPYHLTISVGLQRYNSPEIPAQILPLQQTPVKYDNEPGLALFVGPNEVGLVLLDTMDGEGRRASAEFCVPSDFSDSNVKIQLTGGAALSLFSALEYAVILRRGQRMLPF